MYNARFSALQQQNFYQHFRGSVMPGQYLEINNDLDLGSFLGGSESLPYTDHEYRYLVSGGGGPSSSAPTSADATGLAIIGPADVNVFHAQPCQNSQQSWQWIPAPAPGNAYATRIPAPPGVYHISDKSAASGEILCSPSPKIPTPAMAVLLNPKAYADSPVVARSSSPVVEAETRQSTSTRQPRLQDTEAGTSSSSSRSREKKHGCWMCHKSFDRPSTLRKVTFIED